MTVRTSRASREQEFALEECADMVVGKSRARGGCDYFADINDELRARCGVDDYLQTLWVSHEQEVALMGKKWG